MVSDMRNLKISDTSSKRIHSDGEVMRKIKQLVKGHDVLKGENLQMAQKEAENTVQIELLVQRVKDTHEKKEQFKTELRDALKKN